MDPKITDTDMLATETIPLEISGINERYTLVGVEQGSVVSLHKNPTADSPIVGQITFNGTDILSTGEI